MTWKLNNCLLLNGFADPVAATEKPIQECCACGTAKYRVTFYGNWSEKVHPKDYPSKNKPFGTGFKTHLLLNNIIILQISVPYPVKQFFEETPILTFRILNDPFNDP